MVEDLDILKQQEELQNEIAERSPMFTKILPVSALSEEYANNQGFLDKLPFLSEQYRRFRRTRGDGNCFYRSFVFSLLEQFIHSKDELSDASSGISIVYGKVLETVKTCGPLLESAGFEPICYEDFVEALVDILENIQSHSIESIETQFEDKMFSDCLVMFTRFLTSAYLRTHAEKFEGFVEGYSTIEEFCKVEVDPMDRECDHLQILAMAEAFSIKVHIVYLDRSPGPQCTQATFPYEYSGPDFQVNLLYRPGHYDIIYP